MTRIAFCLLFTLSFAGLKAQQTGGGLSKSEAEKYYKAAQKDFIAFEQLHGAFVETKNVRMHYLHWGDLSGIPLIWSHGSLTNGYELADVAEGLVKAGYYVIAIDYYGHGQTPIPKHEVSLYHIADDISFLMDHLKIKKAVIGGWSRGGVVSTAFYDAYPERVLGLILEDGGSVSMNSNYHRMTPAGLEETIRKITENGFPEETFDSQFDAYAHIYEHSDSGNQFHLLNWIQKTESGRWAISPGAMKLFNMNNAAAWSNVILRPTLATLFGESMSIVEPKIVYRNLDVPLLILDPTSKDDFMPFEADNKALQEQHQDLIIHRIYENTGHNIHYEKPKEFIVDLAAFLIRVKAFHKIK